MQKKKNENPSTESYKSYLVLCVGVKSKSSSSINKYKNVPANSN